MCAFWKDLIGDKLFAVFLIGGGYIVLKYTFKFMKAKKIRCPL